MRWRSISNYKYSSPVNIKYKKMQLRKSTKQATQRSIEHAKLQAEKKNQRKQKRTQVKTTVEKVINIFSEYIFYRSVKLIILCYNTYF